MAESLIFLGRILHDIEVNSGYFVVDFGIEAFEKGSFTADARAKDHLFEEMLRLFHLFRSRLLLAHAGSYPAQGFLIKQKMVTKKS